MQINPLVRHATPTSSQEIMNRVNEITFNSSLLSEFRAIEFVARLIDQGRLPRGKGPGQYRRINVHRIVLDSEGKSYTAASKLSNDYDFFEMLRDHGRRAARRFLDEHFDDIGVEEHGRPAQPRCRPVGVITSSGGMRGAHEPTSQPLRSDAATASTSSSPTSRRSRSTPS